MACVEGGEVVPDLVRNTLRDTDISGAQKSSPEHCCGRLEEIFELNTDVAAGAGNTTRPLTPPTSHTPKEGAVLQPTQMGNAAVPDGTVVDPVPPGDARNYLTAALDSVRKAEQTVRIDKRRFTLLARDHGFTNAEIGELLGVTEAAVRAAVLRAKQSPDPGCRV